MYEKEKFITSYLSDAEIRLKLSKFAIKNGSNNTAIRECQDAIELISKALLFSLGHYVPETHNLKHRLRDSIDLFSKDFQKTLLDKHLNLIGNLRIEREKAFYGLPDQNLTSAEIYTKEKAEKYLEESKNFLKDSENELGRYLK